MVCVWAVKTYQHYIYYPDANYLLIQTGFSWLLCGLD